MRRGDIVVVSVSGDYGKPRPAVVVQSDVISDALDSVILCQLTSTLSDISSLRVTIEPTDENGLQIRSQIMADKPITVRRHRVGRRIGVLTGQEISRLNSSLAFALGLAD